MCRNGSRLHDSDRGALTCRLRRTTLCKTPQSTHQHCTNRTYAYLGTRSPFSLPSRKATQSSSLDTVGSSPNTSSPTGAPAMASRSLLQGFVTVSLRRSTTGAEEAPGAAAAAAGVVVVVVVVVAGGSWVVTVTAVRVWQRICVGTATATLLVLFMAVFLLVLLPGPVVLLATLRFLFRCALPRPTMRPGILCPFGDTSAPRDVVPVAAVTAAARAAVNMLAEI